MKKIHFQFKPEYADYLSGHRLNNQRNSNGISLLLILIGIIWIYLGLNGEEIDTFNLIAGGYFFVYSILIRPQIFNYKIKKRWNNRYRDLEFGQDNYSVDEDGIQAETKEGTVNLKWTDFKGYKKNRKVLNLYFANSTDWLTIPLYHLDNKTKASLIELVATKFKRMPTQ